MSFRERKLHVGRDLAKCVSLTLALLQRLPDSQVELITPPTPQSTPIGIKHALLYCIPFSKEKKKPETIKNMPPNSQGTKVWRTLSSGTKALAYGNVLYSSPPSPTPQTRDSPSAPVRR